MNISITKDKQRAQRSTANFALTSIQPFYIDRKARPTLPHSPRCLSPIKSTLNLHPFSYRFRENQQGQNKMTQLSQRALMTKANLEWNHSNTLIFKQKIKTLLREYFQKIGKKNEDTTKKVQKERLAQISKISKSFQQLLQTNQHFYKVIKQKYLLSCCGTLKSRVDSNQTIEEEDESFQFIDEFNKKVFDGQKDLDCINQKNWEDKIESLFPVQRPIKERRSCKQPQIFRRKRSTMQQFPLLKKASLNQFANEDSENKEQKSNQKVFLKNIKSRKESQQVSSTNQNNQSFCSSASSNKADKNSEYPHHKNHHSSAANLASDKFYQVIKEVLQRKKKGETSDSTIRRQGLTALGLQSDKNEGNQNQKNEALKSKNANQTRKSSKLQEKERKNRGSRNSKIPKYSEINSKIKSKRVTGVSQQDSKKNKFGKQKKVKKQRRLSSKSSEGKIKQKSDSDRGQVITEKKKTKKFYKVGLNYAKFIGKIRSNDNDKLNINLQKFKKFSRFATRQAFLRRVRNDKLDEEEQEDYFSEYEGQRQGQFKTRSSLLSKESSISSVSRKCRMTKYEETRLLYNMRNVLSSRPAQNGSNNVSIDSQSNRKRSSIFIRSLSQQSENIFRSKRGSFALKKNSKEQYEDDSNEQHVATKLMVRAQRKIKNSAEIRFGQDPKLVELRTLQEFDLKAAKENIGIYLRSNMFKNEKAKEMYKFFMYIEKQKKTAITNKESVCELDPLKIQKQYEDLSKFIKEIEPITQDYEGCRMQYDYWSRRQENDISTKKITEKLDARVMEIIYWSEEKEEKVEKVLEQCSIKQIQEISF